MFHNALAIISLTQGLMSFYILFHVNNALNSSDNAFTYLIRWSIIWIPNHRYSV
jgi:hypothetical protein